MNNRSITIPYTKTKHEVMAYCQESGDEFSYLYDLMDDANKKLIAKERQIQSLKEENNLKTCEISRLREENEKLKEEVDKLKAENEILNQATYQLI